MRAQLPESKRGEAPAIETGRALLELVLVAHRAVLAGEGFQERDPAAEFRQPGQPAVQFARVEIVQDVAADQQVHGRAGAQLREVAEARQVQVATAAMAGDRVLAAVEPEVLQLRPQLQQRRAPRAFAAPCSTSAAAKAPGARRC